MNARPSSTLARTHRFLLPLPLAALAAFLLGAARDASAQGVVVPETSAILPPVPATASALTPEQRAFFRELALLNARQLSLAAEAAGRANQSSTRDFAEWVRREHQTFAEELGVLAKALGDESAARADPPPITERPAWANENDDDYDEGYVRASAELSGRIIERLAAVEQSSETTVATFAQKHLPGLRSRNQRAADLQRTL